MGQNQSKRQSEQNILEKNKRPDDRKLDEIRPLYCEVSLIPRVHGSAIFMRGDTQALSIVTLAAPSKGQPSKPLKKTALKIFFIIIIFHLMPLEKFLR